jgi:2,3-diaminopropionate biosynthesis protein SbnA
MEMLNELETYSRFIGNTPLKDFRFERANLFAKLEFNNFSGSSKDRAGFSMIYNAVKEGRIDRSTTVIASSSGNLAIAIASICRFIGIKFIPVIDPNINKDYEMLLNLISYKTVKVTKRDNTGGYLLTRVEKVDELCREIRNSFCADQYRDPNNYRGYYSLADELMESLPKTDMIFIAVSSGGAITGVSRALKAKNSAIRIIGVDVVGSVIFGQMPETRYVSGIGSSMVPPILENAIIDDVLFVSQIDIIKGCKELLSEQLVFGGASCGAVYLGAKRYLEGLHLSYKPTAIMILPDKGFAYMDTIYNKDWEWELEEKLRQPAL